MSAKRKIITTNIILIILVILFVLAGGYFLNKGFKNYKTVSITYDENNEVHYKVYLKENNFFDEPYLNENRTYITNLINYINVDYKYDINFNKKVSGNYSYYISATIEADKSGNEEGVYWTKEYILTDEKQLEVTNVDSYTIIENLNIDYQKYNEILNDFKKSVGITLDGKLILSLVVKNNLTNKSFSGEKIDLPDKSHISLSVPLSQLAVEASVDTNADNSHKTITKTVKEKDVKYIIYKISGFLLIISGIYGILYIRRKNNEYRVKYNYEIVKNKILNTYDSIIVNVKASPNVSKLNCMKVESFEELIDAHSEVRMPINFYESKTKKECIFTLIHENKAWQYILKSNNEQDNKKNKKTNTR